MRLISVFILMTFLVGCAPETNQKTGKPIQNFAYKHVGRVEGNSIYETEIDDVTYYYTHVHGGIVLCPKITKEVKAELEVK